MAVTPIEYINKSNLDKEVKDIFNDYYKLFEKMRDDDIDYNKYKTGDDVILSKGTLLHGIKSYNLDIIENIKENGIILAEYRGQSVPQQKYCVCFWIMNKDTKLFDYIDYYSGDTIYLKNRFRHKFKNIYIPFSSYDGRDEIFNNINKFKYKVYFVRESKENRFMPTMSKKNKDDYIAFIINNKYTNEIINYDLYQGKIDINIIKKFIPEWAVKVSILNKLPTQTDHEISITFGLPSNMIEGILVGRLIETDKEKLKELKKIFSNCYICNLDGKVIVSNK